MSKNVAVFIDVANIFYAAKAAGVDIDYVTLLKSATAGRDFVRAYAYTGLDPENENQRQFHSFLSRSGYKVVSKDIRKYGDGRIKANLDIELVVDMMRIAQHIDIAVVVSGDGDFAPAIRAVQQMGVRCEVISFRGNTSSDLIDVADVFTDITQIARVEKGARSGRRVASEDDLSMTAVPEKETEGGPRRRRGGRRTEREERPADRVIATTVSADATGMPGNLIVLPGEKLSRAPGDEVDEELGEELGEAEPLEGAPETVIGDDESGRRRRRRRGGRGRGRGRRGEGEVEVGPVPVGTVEAGAEEDDEDFVEEELAPMPQHSTFGSVWDSQLGVPSIPLPAVSLSGGTEDEDDEDEPEIPEYLLAERRQQGRRGGRNQGRPGQGRVRPGYQSAVDRERYGRSGQSAFGGGGGGGGVGMSRPPDRGRPSGGRGPRPQQQHARPPRPSYTEQRETERPVASAEPWSEVPADVQELLRAELARRQAAGPAHATQARSAPPSETSGRRPAPRGGGRGRGRPSAGSSPEGTAAAVATPAVAEPAPSAATASTTRRRSARSSAGPAKASSTAEEGAKPATAVRARRTRAASAEGSDASGTSASTRKRTITRPAPAGSEAADEGPAAKPRRRTSRTASSTAEEGADS